MTGPLGAMVAYLKDYGIEAPEWSRWTIPGNTPVQVLLDRVPGEPLLVTADCKPAIRQTKTLSTALRCSPPGTLPLRRGGGFQ